MSLPPPDERERLTDAIAELVRRQGYEPLCAAHLVEPTPRYFPDEWAPDRSGVAYVALRLLGYAELFEFPVQIDLGATEGLDTPLGGVVGHGTWYEEVGPAAWLLEFDGETCSFGVHARQAAEPAALVPSLCHEVARVYRRVHGLAVPDPSDEERLVDVTTVFLGFGILTCNGADRYAAVPPNGYVRTTSGVLGPEEMAFLLAVQAVARQLDDAEVDRVAEWLQGNRATAFREGVEHLRRLDRPLVRRLALPSRKAFPEWPRLEDYAPGRALDEGRDADPDAPPPPPPAGPPVFRVRGTRERHGAAAGAWIGLGAGLVFWLGSGSPAWSFLGGVGGACIGTWIGRRRPGPDHCSEPECGAELPAGAGACPGCGRPIAGEIANRDERLAAEEALAEVRSRPPGRSLVRTPASSGRRRRSPRRRQA